VAGSPEIKTVDLAIIGAGPAGLAASVYASRYRLGNVVIGPELGGYVSTTHLVEDYLGFAAGWGTADCSSWLTLPTAF
jgi:thioredoxin reductase (NADPH)